MKEKFLVDLLSRFSKPSVLFAVWFVIVGIFCLLIASYYRRMNRRNFRSPDEGAGLRVPVDARRLSESNLSKDLSVKKNVGIKKSYPKK